MANNAFLRRIESIKLIRFFIVAILSFEAHSENGSNQGEKLILGTPVQEIERKDVNLIDQYILIKQYENYESYRPDSFSDATRNPFGPKKIKVEDFIK